jgi:IS30 family transposase
MPDALSLMCLKPPLSASPSNSAEQVAAELPISDETLYQHIYADKAAGGTLRKNLRCQKKRKKRYASRVECRGQIVGNISIE